MIPAVPWPEMPTAIASLVARGFHVLAETPPAPDLDGLRALWSEVGDTGLVQVAEQYTLMPAHAASLAARARRRHRRRRRPSRSRSTHLYHAVSLIRHLLGVGFEEATVSAREFTAPLVDPLTPAGWTDDPTPKPATTTLATLDFGGRSGLYDFTDNQWWNPLRSRRIVIRGSLGEIVDDRVDPDGRSDALRSSRRSYVAAAASTSTSRATTSSTSALTVASSIGIPLRAIGSPRTTSPSLRSSRQRARWARDEGPPPYPLAEGLQDHRISLAIGESASTGQDVVATRQAWTW